jgi:hypothetical protein
MDGLSDDDLLANAIGYVALVVLRGLAGDADARRAYLEDLLRLIAAHGADVPDASGVAPVVPTY